MTDREHTPFEDRLGSLLEARADRIEVVDDLDGLLARPGPVGSTPAVGRWWLAMAAAVLAIVGLGAALVAGAAPTTDGQDEAEIGPAQGEPSQVQPGDDPDMIVWLDPAITPEELGVVALAIETSSDLSAAAYLDTEATWAEFRDHFADQPEILELVEPEQLPTSFRIITSKPEAVAAVVGALPGVDEVEAPVTGAPPAESPDDWLSRAREWLGRPDN